MPRIIPALGLIGGPLMSSSVVGQILGINEHYSAWSAIALLPIFAWEFALGLWLVFKGFNRSAPILAEGSTEHSASVRAGHGHPSGAMAEADTA